LVFDLKVSYADGYMEIDEGENILTSQEPFLTHPLHLSQLVFIVGHVAIKQIVHLEVIETEWKRRKAEDESKGIKLVVLYTKNFHMINTHILYYIILYNIYILFLYG